MAGIAAFIDLQGTLGGDKYGNISSFSFYPFSIEAIKKLNDNGILVIGITNQSQISWGKLTWNEYEYKLQKLKDELLASNAYFDAVYCCPHNRNDNCLCKKPKTGMIDFAKKDFDIDIKNSFVIGDMGVNDMILAKTIDAKAILVLTGAGSESINENRHTWQNTEPDFVAKNVLEAVNHIISEIRS